MARVALVAGICVRHDAISNVVRLQERLLGEAGHEVKVYSHHTDYPGKPHLTVTDAWTLQRETWFRSADLVIFHFGIRYGLFDALLLSHPGAVRVVHFHNVTPPELLGEPARSQAVAALDQMSIIDRADMVWSDSKYNTESLLERCDIDPTRIIEMPLCVEWLGDEQPSASATKPHSRRSIIAVGRLLEAKGQLDLVAAVAMLPRPLRDSVLVHLIGSLGHSDPVYIQRLRDLIAAEDLGDNVRIEMNLDDDALRRRYGEAEIFVSTSRHEGFCVPVIEALAANCRVITTDAGALPETAGPCGQTVPVGDVAALSTALKTELEEASERQAGDCDDLVSKHLEKFSLQTFCQRLLDGVEEALKLVV